jgi:galactose mutarotase-like enzyme
MLYTLENEKLICTIESNGAEIRSLKNKATGAEYIWQIDKSIWGSSSPVLFPAIGKTKEDKVVFNEKSIQCLSTELSETTTCLVSSNMDLLGVFLFLQVRRKR